MGFPGRWHPKISRDKTVFLAQNFVQKLDCVVLPFGTY